MDEINKPIVKLFIYNDNKYVYDTSTNLLLQVSQEHFNQINLLIKLGINNYLKIHSSSKEYLDIVRLYKKGLFKPKLFENVENYLTPYIKQMIKSCINYLILQVTQECNFKCRYCNFAIDNGIDRHHNSSTMSWEIAKKSIDYLYKNSRDVSEINVAFYGGEPLMNYNLIKKVVNYCNNLFKSKIINYYMTTNASLLSKQRIQFLVKNKFRLSLSFDGPEDIQNLHRSFLYTGDKTFNIVYENLMFIKNNYYEYFKKYISIMAVIIRGENYEKVNNYFQKLGVNKNNIHILDANLNGVDYYNYQNENTIFQNNKNNYSLLELIEKKKDFFEDKSIIKDIWHHSGTCIPAVRRLFVDINGYFYPCEKILLTNNLNIGNIYDGLNYEKIVEFSNIAKITNNDCRKCWAIRFCEICVSQCNDIEKCQLTYDQKRITCEFQRDSSLTFLKNVIKESEERKQ